jgi:hypothetical protein
LRTGRIDDDLELVDATLYRPGHGPAVLGMTVDTATVKMTAAVAPL